MNAAVCFNELCSMMIVAAMAGNVILMVVARAPAQVGAVGGAGCRWALNRNRDVVEMEASAGVCMPEQGSHVEGRSSHSNIRAELEVGGTCSALMCVYSFQSCKGS